MPRHDGRQAINETSSRNALEPLETPAFENIETLVGKYGDEGNKLIFKILKRGEHESSGEADLALRYDLTVPLARVVAQYRNELPRLFKRYQIQPVWRADRPARGRFREFYQCDIDAMGSTSPVVDADILSAVSEILTTLGFDDFTVRLNHRGVLAALLETAGVPATQHGDALVALDKLDKIGAEGVGKELAARGIPETAAAKAMTYFCAGALPLPHEALARLTDVLGDHRAVSNLADIVGLAESTSAAGRIRIDPSLARGLSYYTGAIMEIAVEGIGSLGGGGRYDNLIGMFLGRDVPACGFSLGLERIIVVMSERGMFPPTVAKGSIDAVITFMDDDSRAEALRLATELRATKIRVDVFPESSRKFDKSLKYSSARGAGIMAIFGENERTRGEVSIRDLHTREQQAVPRDQAPAVIARLLNLEPGTRHREHSTEHREPGTGNER
ncbi:MAG: histidine--tRNA ligase [Acidobacteria bacterium]|nr:MAG: histidine--tRNA ligase [Acidobacteriota bacterium]